MPIYLLFLFQQYVNDQDYRWISLDRHDKGYKQGIMRIKMGCWLGMIHQDERACWAGMKNIRNTRDYLYDVSPREIISNDDTMREMELRQTEKG